MLVINQLWHIIQFDVVLQIILIVEKKICKLCSLKNDWHLFHHWVNIRI